MMRFILAIIGIALVLSTSGFAQMVGDEVEINIHSLKVRAREPAGSGVLGHPIGYASEGEKFTVIGLSTTNPFWIKIRYSDKEGWIKTEYKGKPVVKVIETTARPTRISQVVKMDILGTNKLRSQVQQTSYFRRIMRKANKPAWASVDIYWKFKNQTNDLAKCKLALRGSRYELFVIDFLEQRPWMPVEKYVEILKQDGISPEIEIYTVKKEPWFTLYPEDYAMQAGVIPHLAAQLRGTSIAGGDAQEQLARLQMERTCLENERRKVVRQRDGLKQEKDQLENEVEKLKEQIEILQKKSEYDEGTDALKALQQAGNLSSVENADVPRGEQQLRSELKKVEAERDNLQSQLQEFLEKDYQKVMRKPSNVGEENQVRRLEEKLERTKKENNHLKGERKHLKERLESQKKLLSEATKMITELQKSSSKRSIRLIPLLPKKDGKQFVWVLPLPSSKKQMKFVFVESGRFTMGLREKEVNALIRKTRNPLYESQRIQPGQHLQEIKNGFLIGKYEVTNEEYQALNPDYKYAPTEERKPVTNLTEREIRAFYQTLNEVYPQLDIGLPTEKEWEYAAKGPEGKNLYTWGSEFDKDKANVGSGKLMEVGQKTASDSWCGASDMIGNAAEVCEIDNESYTHRMSQSLVVRGGAYTSDEYESRTISRVPVFNTKLDNIGFRIVIRLKNNHRIPKYHYPLIVMLIKLFNGGG